MAATPKIGIWCIPINFGPLRDLRQMISFRPPSGPADTLIADGVRDRNNPERHLNVQIHIKIELRE